MKRADWNNCTDEDLVRSYLDQKDEDIFGELYVRYNDRIFSYMRKFLYYAPEDIIEELLSEVFIRVYLNMARLKEAGSFKSWIYHIAHNICINYIRSQKDTVRDGQEILESTADKRVDIEKEAEENEIREFIAEQLKEFDDETREVVIFKFYNGLTYEEIAEMTRQPVRSLKYRMKLALEKLSVKLKSAGYMNGCMP